MMRHVLKARIDRLLRGDFRPEDLTALFLHLRQNASGVVREIGDFIAHPEGRNRGLVTEEARDFFAAFRWHFGPAPSSSISSSTFCRAMRSTLEKLDTEIVTRETGLKRDAASKVLSSALAKVEIDQGRQIEERVALTEQEKLVLKTCRTRIAVRPAFTDADLYRHFCLLLQRNDLLVPDGTDRLVHIKSGLTLYAIAQMHQVSVDLEDGSEALLGASVTNGVVEVSATADVSLPQGVVNFSSAIFQTSLEAKECCEPGLLSDAPSYQIRHHIEVDTNQRIVPLG